MNLGCAFALGCMATGATWSAWTGEPTVLAQAFMTSPTMLCDSANPNDCVATDGGAVAIKPDATSRHPDRGDAMHCVIDRELRAMDPKSPYLPENGWPVAGGYGCHYQQTTKF